MHKSGTSCSAKWKEIESWREEKKETGVHRLPERTLNAQGMKIFEQFKKYSIRL